MAITAIAAAVNHSRFYITGNFELTVFIFIKRPQVILPVEICFAAGMNRFSDKQ